MSRGCRTGCRTRRKKMTRKQDTAIGKKRRTGSGREKGGERNKKALGYRRERGGLENRDREVGRERRQPKMVMG